MQSVKQMNNQDGRLNEKFIDLMEQLSDIMLKQGEPFRARAYQKAQETIMSYPGDILSPEDLKNSPGIGKTIMEKLNEYVETGTLQILEREKVNPINILSDVYGIGPKKAKELVDNGITSIEQLRANQDLLNDIQRVGLRYYEDILKRIPRSEIEDYKVIFEHLFPKGTNSKMDTNSKMEIVGSYRRGAMNSGDIDVIITSNNANVFTTFIDNLIKEKIITHVLSRGPTKCLVIAKIPSSNSYRRVDFLYTTPEEFPFAILYFTGSKIFNTVMRHIALEKGYTMNEHGLYTMEDKKKGSKINHTFMNEADIFDFLGLVYKAPNERIDGRAVIFKNDMNNNMNDFNSFNDLNENILVAKKKTTKTLKKKSSPVTKTAKKTKAVKSKKVELVIEDDEDDVEDDKNFVNNGNSSVIVSGPSPILLANNFRKYGLGFLQQLNEEQLNSIIYQANIA